MMLSLDLKVLDLFLGSVLVKRLPSYFLWDGILVSLPCLVQHLYGVNLDLHILGFA